MPTENNGRIHNSNRPKKKLKNTIGFQSAQRSFSACESWLIQSVVRTQHRNISHAARIFQRTEVEAAAAAEVRAQRGPRC